MTVYDIVQAQDAPNDGPHIRIQWKGTDVCCDVHCKCGHFGHIDGGFFYTYKCPCCGTVYAVGAVVKLIEVTPEQAFEIREFGPTTDECDDFEDDEVTQ